MKRLVPYILLIAVFGTSCSSKIIPTRYYEENKEVLDRIEESYSKLYKQKAFTLGFSDKYFQTISLEIITDSLKYVYEFGLEEKRIKDTLLKYDFDVSGVTELVREMRSIRCTWIDNFDHYVDGKKKALIFISIKPVGLGGFFSKKKYYILTYFSQPQYYDKDGRLLDNRKQRELQKLNGEIFRRINDKVCYTISSNYR
ncbi:MAG: hypothetical protein JST02_14860 [Bacteroidetes bacterium]|nr:hypothetical protein [Bacteroidota bacterium]